MAVAGMLIVRVHDAGRSQTARALLNHHAKEGVLPFRANSARTEPAGVVHANVIAAMRDLGLDLEGVKPKLLTDAMVREAPRVIAMGSAVDSARGSSC